MAGLFLSTIALIASTSFATPTQKANEVIRLLAQSGIDLLENNEAPLRSNHSFFNNQIEVDTRVFEQKILKQTNDDPFIDAFVRWQLVGFNINLPELSDFGFQQLLEQLPNYPENPRANLIFCDTLARASASDRPLGKTEIVSLRQRLEDINKQYRIARSRAIPADQFRLWLIEKLQQQPARLALAHLERISATVSAGWPYQTALLQAEIAFVDINSSGGLDSSSLREIERIATRISGINRLVLLRVDTSYDGRITPHWRSTAVDEFDLKRLLRLLRITKEETDGFLGRDRQPPVKSTP
ncbi:MAG: hypothetical protein QF444_01145 [Phycisphaerales bacterium]|jgi:hypothetical protein|nr:hypothetical protein [Phycisphaerales bacterium]MDP6692906.1 hypothetical protein [Phycisphaerales bacterium]